MRKTGIIYHLFSPTEQNLKRLRDINEEIQKLRMVNSQRGSREVQHSYKVTVLYAVVGPHALSTVHTSEPLNNIGVISLTKGNGHCYLATCWINGSPMVKSQAMPYKQRTGQPLLLVQNHTNLSSSFGKLVG